MLYYIRQYIIISVKIEPNLKCKITSVYEIISKHS